MRARPTVSRLRFVAPSVALLLASCGGSSGPIDGGRAMAHVRAMVGFGPRPFGSEALGKTADYIGGELKKLGLEMKRHEMLEAKEKKTIRNLYVQIDGEDAAKGPILMIGAHYDTKLAEGLTGKDAEHNHRFVGAIDGGGGPAVLIELARELKGRAAKPKCNVWLYWIDAEESLDWTWNDERALLGSKAFCKWLVEQKVKERVKAFVLIDLIGSKDYKVDLDGNSQSQLQDVFTRAAQAMGEQKRVGKFPSPEWIAEIKRQAREKGHEANWGITDDHIVFRQFGVPAVLLIDFDRRIPGSPQVAPTSSFHQWWHTAEDDLPAMDADALAFTGNLVLQALPDLENFVLGKK